MGIKRIIVVLMVVVMGGLIVGEAGAVNVLFYGNSYTRKYAVANVSLPDMVKAIADAAGQPDVFVKDAAHNGRDFAWHLSSNQAVIGNTLSAGENWDYVVMQNYSTRTLTSHSAGDLTKHRQNSVKLYQAVADHSGDVVPVLFETWSRAPGSPVMDSYADGRAGQDQMQAEIKAGYALAAGDIDIAADAVIAKIAGVGTAWQTADFSNLHHTDHSHANQRGRMLSALVMYSTIFEDDTRDLLLSGKLDTALGMLNLSYADGDELTLVSDAVASVPEPVTGMMLVVVGGGMMLRRRRIAG
ncbi:hypothetical protein KS4_07340 [Poriferisphaera corsica]|uniref:PEP-CTERM protein-sorting domain-containing protein n=1 Tax=Poriferisphaera corsica TaxID=2528020 RepID=A0A517YR61_9BACT|nr:hypothetical protein KS4_07340 [Poriferisphaera corsica]